MTSVWRAGSRLAAWAPDAARELIANAQERGPHDDARAAEILGRAFAATTMWDLAQRSFEAAAQGWDDGDPARALCVRGVAKLLPVAPFADDEAALAAELELVTRVLDATAATPVVRRTIVELRRSVAPRRVTGWIEAALGLSPTELALLMAAAAPLLDPHTPSLGAAEWEALVASSTLAPAASVERLVRMGAIIETPALVVAPPIASWLLGRRALEHPAGVRLHRVRPALANGDTASAGRLVVDGLSVLADDPAALAHALTAFGRSLIELRPAARATRDAIVTASIEARLHGGIPLVDVESWEDGDAQLAADLAPCAVVTPRAPALAEQLRGIVAP